MHSSTDGTPGRTIRPGVYDIFVCSHSGALGATMQLLKALRPFGTIHLVSSYLFPAEVALLEPWFDHLLQPTHHPDGYRNFNLFCIRDLHRVATAPFFIKVDTDVQLSHDWIDYVEETVAAFPDVVLFGPHAGTNPIDYWIEGRFIERTLGGPVEVQDKPKVNGSFYVGRTEFFRQQEQSLLALQEALYAFSGGRRIRETAFLPDRIGVGELCGDELRLRGSCRGKEGSCVEDELRSLLVHATGATDKLVVRDSNGRVGLPDKMQQPSRVGRVVKLVKRRLGIPIYHSGHHAA